MDLAEVLRALEGLSPEELAATQAKARAYIEQVEGKVPVWFPNPGPQTECYWHEAEEILFGGEAGGGKSQVLIGLSLTQHERSLLLRRTNKEAGKFVEEIADVLGSRDAYHSREDQWRVDGRLVDIGGCQWEDDKGKYKGTPHDLIGFDEVTDFTLSQYMFIRQWNRTTTKGQRCRTVATSNGPTDPSGLWVVQRWAAWLDPTHPNPAQSGELRWYLVGDDGKEREVDGPGPYQVHGRTVNAKSRTFIRSRLDDNPDLAATGYASTVMAQGDENRRAIAMGDFTGQMEDREDQAIPTAWVMAAVERWGPVPPPGVPLCSIGFDVAQGGKDECVVARRHDGWFAKLLTKPGKETPTGTEAAAFVLSHRRDNAAIVIDVGGGWGAEAYGHLRAIPLENITAYMGVKTSVKRSADRQFTFANIRSEAYWRVREALNPDQPGGSLIALPNDRLLIADLCAPRYEVRSNGVHLEPKDKVCERLGRSTDRGDAVVMCWWAGARMAVNGKAWFEDRPRHGMPQVIKSSASDLMRRRR
jgi:hypothetical protein